FSSKQEKYSPKYSIFIDIFFQSSKKRKFTFLPFSPKQIYAIIKISFGDKRYKAMKEEFKMEKSKVYFTSMKVNAGTNLLKKLNHLIKEAGIANIDFENKYTAIKIHFGEPGNLAYLRPNYAKV